MLPQARGCLAQDLHREADAVLGADVVLSVDDLALLVDDEVAAGDAHEFVAVTLALDLSKLEFVGRALGQLRSVVGGQAAVLGFVGSPWTLATYIIEGASSSL